ncbi:hypothetical protein Aros01_07697 [Streptosporangium roseum]|uniref:Uncharacterized protein n=2 Tax=Streptosporangium roseum TaxID=2001 RepID=D2BB53_STRRD|nr:hypothetical protein Sros_9198 [Streptosporangium roseum DSM 43021]
MLIAARLKLMTARLKLMTARLKLMTARLKLMTALPAGLREQLTRTLGALARVYRRAARPHGPGRGR